MSDEEIILGGDENIWKDYTFILHYATKKEKAEIRSYRYDLHDDNNLSYIDSMKKLVDKYRYIIDRPPLSAEELRDDEEEEVMTKYSIIENKATEIELEQIKVDFHDLIEKIVANRQSHVDLMAELVEKYRYILER